MRTLERQIIELREQGKTYNEIKNELNCSKGTISYYLGIGQKAKTRSRRFLRQEEINRVSRSNRLYLQELSQRYKRMCGCKHCGINNPLVLQFDHINPSDKITTIAQMISDRYGVRTFKEEIRKCQVLCANCHILRTVEQFNYVKF